MSREINNRIQPIETPEDYLKPARNWKDLPLPEVPDKKLVPEYMYADEAARYILSTKKKLALLRQKKLIKCAKTGKSFIYKRSWLDEFMEDWQGYDLSSPEKIDAAIREKNWRRSHGFDS